MVSVVLKSLVSPSALLAALLLLSCSDTAAHPSRPLRGLQVGAAGSNNITNTTTPSSSSSANTTTTVGPASPLYSSAQEALQLRLNNNNSWTTNGTRYNEHQYFLTNRDEKRAVCNLTFAVPVTGGGNVSSSYNVDLKPANTRDSSGASAADSSSRLEGRAASYASRLEPRAVLTFGYILQNATAGNVSIVNAAWC